MTSIICDVCQVIKQVKYSAYKKRTLKEDCDYVACDNCQFHVKKMNKKQCKSQNCKGIVTFSRYYHKKVGLSEPENCKECN